MAIYGFVAAVLPVWVLLAPRDYLSSFLKIGTIALLVIGVIVANPQLQAPAVNTRLPRRRAGAGQGSTIFPFLFITIMCGAISGFHALVSSGTTPKMVTQRVARPDDRLRRDADRGAGRRRRDDRGGEPVAAGLLRHEHDARRRSRSGTTRS